MGIPEKPESGQTRLVLGRPREDVLLVGLKGNWRIADEPIPVDAITREIESDPHIRILAFDTGELGEWDSSLLTFLIKVIDTGARRGLEADRTGLPEGVGRLLSLASAVPEATDARRQEAKQPFLTRVGTQAISIAAAVGQMMEFLGEAAIAFFQLVRGRARLRRVDLMTLIQDCGADALPIVSLISVLVGLILAFVGAVQLRMFGAQIYVADLVGLGMAREMGAMMTAVIMAGRTGAAFAAQLGTMQVNEEIDALQTLGVSPMGFLVLPRMLALVLMMPFLCLYADLMGILGGGIVGVGMLGLSPLEYYHETVQAVQLMDFGAGLIKGAVFGVLIALSGCLRGMQCGRSSAAVGLATTSAVVTGIVAIVVSDAILTVIYDRLGI